MVLFVDMLIRVEVLEKLHGKATKTKEGCISAQAEQDQ